MARSNRRSDCLEDHPTDRSSAGELATHNCDRLRVADYRGCFRPPTELPFGDCEIGMYPNGISIWNLYLMYPNGQYRI